MRSCESKKNKRNKWFQKDFTPKFLEKFNKVGHRFVIAAQDQPKGPFCLTE